MTSRERVLAALNHSEPDRVPIDFGATFATGISARLIPSLRDHFGLEKRPVKIFDPFQMLGEIEPDLINALRSDIIGIWNSSTLLGTHNDTYKPCPLPLGIEALCGEDFITSTNEDGNIYAYPQGDTSAPPCAVMPKGGFYFDAILRQEPFDENDLDARRDFVNDYQSLTDEHLRYVEAVAKDLYECTEYAIASVLTPNSINDFAHLPAPFLKHTPGIRQVEEFLVSHYTHPDYIRDLHEMHVETAIKNMERYHQAVGDRVQVMIMSGADYGTQNGLFMSRDMFMEFVLPYQKRANDWVHANTSWKTFYHSCGAISEIIGDMAEAGADIINPAQYSAKGMELSELKARFGSRVAFWGGAIDTQSALASKRPDEIYDETLKNLSTMHNGSGFIAAPTHNIQCNTPIENVLAYIEALHHFTASNRKGRA